MNRTLALALRALLVALVLLISGLINVAAQSVGDLVVNKVDENGDPLPGACFGVHEDAGGGQLGNFIVQQCEFQDGQMVFTGLAPGNYVLAEFHAPNGYINGSLTPVSVAADVPTIVTISNTPGGSNVTIRKVDANTGELVTGACFVVSRDNGNGQPNFNATMEGICDDSDGSTNGIITFTGLPAGNYLLSERIAPDGYQANEGYLLFAVDGSEDATITVENDPASLVEQLVAVLIEILRDILGR